jgi:hypothetical protein
MVPVGGLEPPRPKATDFESVVYTNFTTLALHLELSFSLQSSKFFANLYKRYFWCSRNILVYNQYLNN